METYKDLSDIPKKTKEVTLTRRGTDFVLQKKKGIFNSIYCNIDLAFPIVHGKGVEDGSLAGYLETIGIPFVGPNTISAAIGQDKIIQKEVMKAAGVNVVDYIWFYDFEYKENEEEILKRIKKLGYPAIVKPARLGSSVGIEISKNDKEIKKIIEEAIKYDEKIIVEKVVENLQEVDCAVVGSPSSMECSLIGEMFTDNDFLTFEDKYIGEGGKG
jgi:D-alanine-D-alanine ligase